MHIGQHYLQTAITTFQSMKSLGDKTFAQLTHEELHFQPSSESNSIAVIVKHISGNTRSRWTDIFTTDGEKPDRNRDAEFEGNYESKKALLEAWETGWNILFTTLGSLKPDDLERKIKIRGEDHTVLQAIERQIAHYSNHMGQIVYIGKLIKNEEWKTLSVARGKSQEFLQEMLRKHKN
ncbi:DUF1572 domain-containing protein [Shimazuella sp. AN120528]|uniref:DUF1572 family protein n=1 Tax=Shimazuella soli TaxID=1892854 RepID=UPI001F0E6545|nr:DUF1572 family protein [Shimazuella soli]MCH5584061.1 DUF1572 domain-containing protein [Shimazuella soli]